MPMIKVLLHKAENNALQVLAKRERRDPRAQAALLIRRELERAGVLRITEIKAEEAQYEIQP